jgi:hypothetical protein
MTGANRGFTLYEPPASNMAVFATYYRNVLNDHQFTLTVATPGITGQGTYQIEDEHGYKVPVISEGTHTVAEANFNVTGLVWPSSFSDMRGVAGSSPDETITLTFQDDGLSHQTVAPIQAVCDNAQTGMRFRSTLTGATPNSANVNSPTAGNPSVAFTSGTACDDASAIVITGQAVVININRDTVASPGGATRTQGELIAYLQANPVTLTDTGVLICEFNPSNANPNPDAVLVAVSAKGFAQGAAATVRPYALRYKVSSSRTAALALADKKGRTGGAQTGVLAEVGADGWLGQTYADLYTGIQFTLVDPNDALSYGYTSLPNPSYHFEPGDTLVFNVSTTAGHVTSVVPQLGIYGLRTKVTTTYGMHPGDTLLVNTYNKAGNEPAVGEFYYVDLTLGKLDSDYGVKYYTNTNDIFARYGDPVPENRASLGGKLMFQNGASIICITQVKKETGLATASDQTYMAAIDTLKMPLPGSDRKADVIVPMSTSPVVQQYLAKHLNIQASPRMRGEAIGFIGLPMYATPEQARTLARGISSERLIMVYPGGAVLSVDINGVATEFAVDGSFLAAAMCGTFLSPANDVATTLTRQKLVGFSRLIKRTADPIMDLMASDGVCLLIERSGALQVRHYVSTSTDNILKREPTTTTIVDYTRQRMRRVLEQFIGRKSVQAVVSDISITTQALLKALIEQEILESYKSLTVKRDEFDPTVVHVDVAIKPIFSILWIDVTFRVTTKG